MDCKFFSRAASTAALCILTVLAGCRRDEPDNTDDPVVPGADKIKTSVVRLNFVGEGATKTFTVTSEEIWAAECEADWLELSPTEGSGTTTVTAVAPSNDSDDPRETTLRIALKSDPSVSVDLPVSQAAAGAKEEPGQVIDRSEFTETTNWGVTGSIMGLNWGSGGDDIPMLGEPGGWMAAFDVTVASGEEFKFRMNGDWATNLGAGSGNPSLDKKYILADDGGNIKLSPGTYDLYVQPNFMILYVEKAGDVFAHGDATNEQEEGENTRIYVLNNSTWTTPYMYAYVGDGGGMQPYGAWPGTYAGGTKSFGDYLYTYWEAAGFSGVGGINLILNDGKGNQYPKPDEKDPLWSDLTIHSSLYFTWDGTTLTAVEDPSDPGVSGKGVEPVEVKFGSSSWTIIGTIGGTEWNVDFPMDTEGYWEVARDLEIAAGEMFKFRQNRSWGTNFGYGPESESGNTITVGAKTDVAQGAGNMKLTTGGRYDIYLSAENKILYVLEAGTEWTHEADGRPDYYLGGTYDESLPVGNKAGGITYQVNVFSFKDSNGDGYGDFNGITQSLDYFDRMGVTALWLSPIQPAQSYHGYDVTDYEAVNPRFGTEKDFQNLITEAHKHNIRIYMDYVMNHSGDQNKWFLDIKKKGPESEYWDYYSITKTPEADIKAGKIDQIPASFGYNGYKWFPVLVGGGGKQRFKIDLDWTNASAPTITVSKTTEAPTTSGTTNNPARYLFWGNSTYTQFYDNGTNKYRLILDFESDWGCLIRTTKADDWSKGTKWGFNGSGDQLKDGEAHTLYSGESDAVQNIVMPGGEMYFYYTEFGTGMFVDFNYGKADQCASSPAFKAIMTGVEKWLGMGVDGFRLDAVKHIYANETGPENKTFWNTFYNECNKIYKANADKRAGLSGIVDENIFMVGEVLSGDGDCSPFYSGLPALFEFQFWWDLRNCLNGETIHNAGYGQHFPGSLPYRWNGHRAYRADAISTPKLANHDEDRTASSLGNYKPKIRQAAAVLLTAAGRPYIYQGEELGYWGTKAGGDEYVRTPILWTPSRSSAASKGVSNKVDWNMLTASISVESQEDDETSLLSLYRHFAYARNTNPALANGWPEADERTYGGYDGHIAGWYLHQVDGDKVVLVLHNFSSYTTDVTRWPGENVSNDNILVSNGRVSVSGNISDGATVTLPGYSSVVFELN